MRAVPDLDWLEEPVAPLSEDARQAAILRQAHLTKPPGALGRLEEVAFCFAAWQGKPQPRLDRVHIVVFAADHGVARQGVSAFPQAVTAEMVRNFARGGAAINVLARGLGAELEIVNLGTVVEPGPIEGVRNLDLGPGSADFVLGPAMTLRQFALALSAGRQAAERAERASAQCFIGGEMGIGNTTAATALACALLGECPKRLAGPGAGLDSHGVARKIEVIERALSRHADHLDSPLDALRRLSGFEIAALAGSYIACAQMGVPALVDGYIATAAALAAVRIHAGVRNWLLFSHRSGEPGHPVLLDALNAKPLLDLSLRLGEGSGAAVCVPLLRLALALHDGMATFTEAGVSERLT